MTVRLHLTTLALQHGWEDLVQSNPEVLPTLEEMPNAEVGAEVVNVLRHGKDPTLAVELAYNLVRKFPNAPAAHASLVSSVLLPGKGGLSIPVELPNVNLTAAVRWVDCDSGESHWVVIEDAPDATITKDEFGSDHPLVRVLLDKKVGDEFPISEMGFRDRRGRVAEIRDKRVFRFQQSLTQWTQRFPDRPFVESVPVYLDEDRPATLDAFREVTKILRRASESREILEEGYRAGKLPIAALAGMHGKPVFETVGYLAAMKDLPVRASRGSSRDFDKVKIALEKASGVVLEPTAVATLALLEESAVIADLPFQCIVTESTLQELRSAIRLDAPVRRAHGYLGYHEGRPIIQEVSEEDEIARLNRLGRLLDWLEAKCTIVGGSDVARLPIDKRRLLMDHLARPSVESAAAASSRDLPIWSDDLLLFTLLKDDLPSSQAWTQSVLMWAQSIGLIARDRYSRATARLFKYGYEFTSLHPETVLDTCEATGWRADDEELAAVLAQFGSRAWDTEVALRITVATVLGVWRQAELVEQARAVTTRILASLVTREDGLRIVSYLRNNVDRLMGLNVVRAEPLKKLLSTFLETGGLLVTAG